MSLSRTELRNGNRMAGNAAALLFWHWARCFITQAVHTHQWFTSKHESNRGHCGLDTPHKEDPGTTQTKANFSNFRLRWLPNPGFRGTVIGYAVGMTIWPHARSPDVDAEHDLLCRRQHTFTIESGNTTEETPWDQRMPACARQPIWWGYFCQTSL